MSQSDVERQQARQRMYRLRRYAVISSGVGFFVFLALTAANVVGITSAGATSGASPTSGTSAGAGGLGVPSGGSFSSAPSVGSSISQAPLMRSAGS